LLVVTGCGVAGWPIPMETACDGQQLQVQGGQVLLAGQAAHAQAHPPPEDPDPLPAASQVAGDGPSERTSSEDDVQFGHDPLAFNSG